ncbi:DEAD/DEAH box helicase [Salinisphaera hydrothermalis]|uniref:ATP-dependent RNA helicase RhlB n=1 Tax=Salinisphaera hydrothermalis (strain C41B8) TaxID=1304275 RepID=A0A084IRA4_SALHC|nr:DEAD/DEAH box helicase [Salinisphaera hydrothermalis]KEZ79238.1 DEAD/DEAH box helicase domain-containing protein [Salinisphaera hydrothermalis C41B8]
MSESDTIADANPRKLVTETRLDTLGLHETIVSGLNKRGFTHATPIQAETLPLALAGGDIAGQAHTGTGKTAAFLLATLDRLLRQPPEPSDQAPSGASQPRALILAPTRELADQIYQDALPLAADTGLKCVVCYGGTGYDTQRQSIADGVDILIGTPGRLIDYYKQKVYTLKAIEVAVLDEADRMFDLGFIDDIRYMFRKMPPPGNRQNLLFSATLSHRVLELAYEHMNDPKLVRTDTETVNIDAIEQKLYHVSKDDKLALLIGTLRRIGDGRTLIFINTKRMAERIQDTLVANGFNAATLSGDVAQKKRLRLLEEFKSGELPIMVATDVAARGLHIPDVSHVINFDLPQDAQDYVHRIGRTARAGNTGQAISFACEEYVYSLPDIEDYIEHKIDAEMPTEDEFVHDFTPAAPRKRKPRGGPNRRRRSGGGNRRSSGNR